MNQYFTIYICYMLHLWLKLPFTLTETLFLLCWQTFGPIYLDGYVVPFTLIYTWPFYPCSHVVPFTLMAIWSLLYWHTFCPLCWHIFCSFHSDNYMVQAFALIDIIVPFKVIYTWPSLYLTTMWSFLHWPAYCYPYRHVVSFTLTNTGFFILVTTWLTFCLDSQLVYFALIVNWIVLLWWSIISFCPDSQLDCFTLIFNWIVLPW